MAIKLEQTAYRGWENCRRLSNGIVDLVVTADVGPRIIRFGFVNDDNEFKEYAEMAGLTGGDEFRIYGGHRLWHAPEEQPRTYFPDNAPVAVEEHDDFLRLVAPLETTTGIQKELEIRLDAEQAHVEVTHRLINRNLWTVEVAPWALSVMAQGGTAIIPLPPRGSHTENLLPTNTLTLWAYTDMTDPRWTWGGKYILLRQDSAATTPQKIGALVTNAWAAYARNHHLFVKKFAHAPEATYPDMGCSVETFTNAEMLELETLAPVARLRPGAAAEHVEHWSLFRDVPAPQNDGAVDEHVLPHVQSTPSHRP